MMNSLDHINSCNLKDYGIEKKCMGIAENIFKKRKVTFELSTLTKDYIVLLWLHSDGFISIGIENVGYGMFKCITHDDIDDVKKFYRTDDNYLIKFMEILVTQLKNKKHRIKVTKKINKKIQSITQPDK